MPILTKENKDTIYYEVHGDPTSATETLILMGGLTRDHTIWRKMLPLLKKDYCVIVFDNRDAGQSFYANGDYTIADLAQDGIDLIKGLDLPPVYLVGHSMGGFMAMYIAAKVPELVKGLILAGTAAKQVPASIEYLEARIKSINNMPASKATTANKEDIMRFMPNLYCQKSLNDAKFIEEILTYETANPYPQSAQSFIRQAKACIGHDAGHILKDISCPVLIIVGEEDKFYLLTEANAIAKIIKHAKIEVIPNAAHMIQLEQPDLFYQAIKNFIVHHNEE